MIATGSGDRTARTWDAATGVARATACGGQPGYAGSGQPRSAAASLKSAGFPRALRSSQLEPFISLSTTGSHLTSIHDKPDVRNRTGPQARAWET
jgi:hypothetical protein